MICEAVAQLVSCTHQIFISGDHAIVVGIVEAVHAQDGDPLLYFARRYGTFTPLQED